MIEMGGHHVKCTEIMMGDPEIVLNEPRSASPHFQNAFNTTHHRLTRARGMVHHN